MSLRVTPGPRASPVEALRGDKGVDLLHDRRMPMSSANIDHLAVGPGGVTVIDAKNLDGKVRVERGGGLLRPRSQRLTVAGRDRTRLVEGVERQIAEVTATLRGLDLRHVDVVGALCFVKTQGLPLLGQLKVRDVPITGPRGVAKLAARPGELDRASVERVVERLAHRLPAAA